jgi:DNA repair exonuclease SbcCD ATPase subunit
MELDETLTSREVINTKMRASLDVATDPWGIKVNRVELKNIIPPAAIQEAMEKQMKAERERREAILRAEGEKKSTILVAEGKKESAILDAEAEKQAAILKAEAQKERMIKEAEGQAEAVLKVQKANVRFLTMSQGQYELKRQEDGTNKKEKAGLELNVIDHYNGTERSVRTLSGGESFQASLSLALGLSDEIQSYAGGIRLDSMFVDEGFGSLDEESLNQAVKALEGLADGNCLVGIISHVPKLKERIEKKIIVTKNRSRDGVGSRAVIE